MSIANEITRLQTAKADIKAAIESKGITVGDGTIDTYAEKVNKIGTGGGYDKGYEDGYNAGNIINPNWRTFSYLCQQRPDLAEKLKYDDTANAVTLQQTFFGYDGSNGNWDIVIPSLNTKKVTTIQSMCAWSPLIVEIGEMDFSSVTNATSAYAYCSGLVRISFVRETIKISIAFPNSAKLDNASKQSIFDGLATVETAQTLTLHKDLKILQSQVDSANTKGWTVVGGTVVSEEEYYAE